MPAIGVSRQKVQARFEIAIVRSLNATSKEGQSELKPDKCYLRGYGSLKTYVMPSDLREPRDSCESWPRYVSPQQTLRMDTTKI